MILEHDGSLGIFHMAIQNRRDECVDVADLGNFGSRDFFVEFTNALRPAIRVE